MHEFSGADPINYRLWLRQRFDARKQRNPRYSLRSYARFLSIAPSTLSELLNGKRALSLELAACIANREGLEPEQRRRFLEPFLGGLESHVEVDENFQQVELDHYSMIADWYHLAIVSLASVKNNRCDPHWVAKRLNISQLEAKAGLKRLIRLGHIRQVGKRFEAVGKAIASPSDVPSSAIRQSHHQLLRKAGEALDECPVEERDFSAIVIAVRQKEIPKIKARVRQFRRELHQEFDEKTADSVYICQFSFFPVSKAPSSM